MDLKQIEYILTIAEEGNITRAAEKLYISQSALNQQLLKLEKELGTQLFLRSHNVLTLTPAGQIYIDSAKKVKMIKRDTYNRIYDTISSEKASLKIGLPPSRGFTMLMNIYPALHERWPNLIVIPTEMNVRSQQEAIENGEIDIGFVTIADQEKTKDHYVDLCKEEIIVIAPKMYPFTEYSTTTKSDLPEVDFRKFKEEPVALMNPESTLRNIIDRIFSRYDMTPHILFETSSTTSTVNMVELGLCFALIPKYYLKKCDRDKVAAFSLKEHPYWNLSILYRKDSYLSDGAHTFINLALQYWKKELSF